MPRIPDVTALGDRAVARPRVPIVQDRSAEIRASALGQAAENVGQIVSGFQERQDRFNYAQAKSTLLQADVEARRSLEGDNDWESYEKRYTEAMTKAREKASGLIRSRSDRALFDMDAKLDVERGISQIRGLAKRKEIDVGRASLDELLSTNRTAALNAKDEATRSALISATTEAIDGAIAKQYVSTEEGTGLRQKWTASYAEGFVSTQPVERRLELLSKPKGTVADYIAPDRRAALLKAAQNENRDLTVRRESQAQTDAIVSKFGGNWTQALAAAREIEDPEVRDSTVTRIKTRQAEAKHAEAEAHDALAEQALAFINDGKKFADLPLDIKNGLKASELSSLRSYAEGVARGSASKTNPETLVHLSMLASDDPQKFGETDLLAFRDRLSDSDFEEFVDLQRKIRSGSLDGKATGFMSINQVRDDRLRDIFGSSAPTSKESSEVSAARRKFVTQYESKLKAFKDQTGKRATAADARKILDDMTADVAINRSYWFDTAKPAYEVTLEDIPLEDKQQAIAALRKAGRQITPESVLQLYIQVNRK